jgi:hypothetical protein
VMTMISTFGSLNANDIMKLAERAVTAIERISEDLDRAADHISRVADELGDLNVQLEERSLPAGLSYDTDPELIGELEAIRRAIEDGNRRTRVGVV